MRTYGQYCPIARGAELFAERWTPVILRNILGGCRTFNDLAAGAPGISRALLTRRLRELTLAGVIQTRPKQDGHGSTYEPTAAGRALQPVLDALGAWAEHWTKVRPQHSDVGAILWSWCRLYLNADSLPDRRVVVRFEFAGRDRRNTTWFVFRKEASELCALDPGLGDDLIVKINDPVAFARWHLGQIAWSTALRSEAVELSGPADLRRALPTWNHAPTAHGRPPVRP